MRRNEVAHQLARRFVGAAAQGVRASFQLSLQCDARQGVGGFRVVCLERGGLLRITFARGFTECLYKCGFVRRVVLRFDAHHDARIGIALVARILAHAVGDDAPGLAGGGHHGATRTHAEAVHRASVGGVVHQLVVGSAQQRVACVAAPAGAVDHALWVLDAKTHRERLGLHVHAAFKQHGKGVARAVAQGHDHMAGWQLVARAIDGV